MGEKFIKHIIDKNITCLAIIGMAKNSGKTVAFNTLVNEGNSLGLKLALMSFGRDGEEIDSLTLKKKPRIKVYPGNYFVTAEEVYKAGSVRAEIVLRTGYLTPFGEVIIYSAESKGYVELIGINSISQFGIIKNQLPEYIDLIILDGALDRRSSAVPTLAEGIILATGAVIANTVERVVEKTFYEIKRLTIPKLKNEKLRNTVELVYNKETNAVIDKEGHMIELEGCTSLSVGKLKKRLDVFDNYYFKVIILKGALINSFIEEIIDKINLKDCIIIIRDGTRVFLNENHFYFLNKNNNILRVLNEINIIGITVNPISPYGVHLNSRLLVNNLRKKIGEIPVYDLRSEEYLSLSGREE